MKIGFKIDSFVCKEVVSCDEIGGILYGFEHEKNGAKLYWMKTDDDNKLFSVGFRTIPTDDTGVFHILEHSVLNGSEKFPVREPFVDLLKSSMNTFLNAMTYPDKTIFPVSSRNQKDLDNLMAVYLDAVFQPKIYTNPNIFYQEGWHYELTEKDAVPSFKGVVFNEMKGALSGVDAALALGLYRSIYKGSCYGFESGGDPVSIPKLSYEQFVSTHKKFYHPTNSIFYLDGNLDFEGMVHKISEYVDKYNRGEYFEIPDQIIGKPEKIAVPYDYASEEPMDDKYYLTLGRPYGSADDEIKMLAVAVLMSWLCSDNSSPLKKAIVGGGLATDIAISVEDSIKAPVLTIKCDNIEKKNAETIKKVLKETVDGILAKGLDKEQLNAAINHIEFVLCEEPSFKGLRNLENVFWSVQCHVPFEQSFDKLSKMKKLRELVDNSSYFEDVLKDLFDFTNMTEVLAEPSKTYGDTLVKEENERLKKAKNSWSEEQIEEIIKLNKNLADWQAEEDSEEAKATIPTLSISDVTEKPVYQETAIKDTNGVVTLYHPIKRIGTTYINLYFDINITKPEELAKYAIISGLFTNLPTEKYDVQALRKELKNYVGSMNFSVSPINSKHDTEVTRLQLVVSISVLTKYVEKALELAKEILLKTDFSSKTEILNKLKQRTTSLKLDIPDSGHKTAKIMATAMHSATTNAQDNINGVAGYFAEKELENNFDENFDELYSLIVNVTKETVTRKRLTIGITGSEYVDIASFVDALPEGDTCEFVKFPKAEKKNVGLVVPSGIAYASKAADYIEIGEKYNPSMRVAGNILTLSHLWNEIRVMGGAYGAGFGSSYDGGLFYYSYRDPNPANSLTVYDKSTEFLREFGREAEDVDSFIIATVSDLEPLETSRAMGKKLDNDYFCGTDYEFYCNYRKAILSTKPETLLELADFIDKVMENASIVVVGGKNLIEQVENLDEVKVL